MITYEIRVTFTGAHSRVIETKDFSFASAESRDSFKQRCRVVFGNEYRMNFAAEWEGEVYQIGAKAVDDLVKAATAPVR